MGIPKFFRWLGGRYPLVCERVSNDNIPEFDNLYLDMNGIIHNCTHPKDGEAPAPATDEERFLAIFYYIDFLFNKIRPRKVFFLGIDGVAPRAKMNEQRARRFRTAKELEELQARELQKRRASGEPVRAEDDGHDDGMFDPTCITPGTEFMDRLTEALRYYINKRVSESADWRRPTIILSAPNVPGEGEHKIMDYIRFSRAQPNYRPNVRHCLYGLDADLIMLGLLSHEPHFSLLREEVLFGPSARKGGQSADPAMQSFYLLHISLLRDYVDHEFGSLKAVLGCSPQYAAMEKGLVATAPAPASAEADAYDLERIIDDYVLMIMLVGNDFLPTLPKLSINSGALNFMFSAYLRIRPTLGGYLHDNGKLNLERFQAFMREVSRFEVDSFKLEVADHKWYQVYKHKAVLRGETPERLSVVAEPAGGHRGGRRGGRNGHAARRGVGFGAESTFELPSGLYSALGEATIPIKDGKLVLSRSQKGLIDLIRRFAIRALPKAAAGHKVQMQFLPGNATSLDSLVVSKAAELLAIHMGREYAHDGSMTLYVAAGSPAALAKLELEDSDSDTDGPGGFLGSATAYHALGALEDTGDSGDEDDDGDEDSDDQAVPDFANNVADPTDEAAVAAYVDSCLGELRDVVVVPDAELDMYTQKGDVHDFWQRFEMWKAAYYKAKVATTYELPNVSQDHAVEATAESPAASGQVFRAPPSAVEPMCRAYMGTIQWVLRYYFQGCPSWSWFYPYHYAPCISDLCADLSAYELDGFAKDQPYTPYEQLMCVLPPYSRKLLPAALRPLMVDVHSPIRDLFPTSFSVDMNGKKMAWEAIVLIDFVDIDRIRAAMAPKLAGLSADEQRRNGRGVEMAYTYAAPGVEEDPDSAPEYPAPSNLKFPPVRPLRCKGARFIMPTLKSQGSQRAGQLVMGLVAGTFSRAKLRPGFPSLFTMEHAANLEFNGTEVFGSPSRDETMMITVEPGALGKAGSTEAAAQELLRGKHVRGVFRPRRLFVFWPYLADAVLVGVSDQDGVYTIDAAGSTLLYSRHETEGEQQLWSRTYTHAVHSAKRERGTVLSEDGRALLLHVLPLRGLRMYPDGSLVRDYGFASAAPGHDSQPWAPVESWPAAGVLNVPAGLAVSDLSGPWANNPRFSEHEAIPLAKAYAVGSRAFYLGRSPLYGSSAEVTGHTRDSAGAVIGVDLMLQAPATPFAAKRENFLGVNALAQHARTGTGGTYKPTFYVAREVGISPLLLSRIASRMLIVNDLAGGDSARVEIGLGLKFEAKRLKAMDYARRAPTGWQYSDRAIALLAKYKAAFPDMFANLEHLAKGDALISASDALASHVAAAEATGPRMASEVRRLEQWVKEHTRGLSLVPIDSEALSKDQVDAIVAACAAGPAPQRHSVVIRAARREAALRPSDAQYLLGRQSLMVGHRVVFVSDRGGAVPIGARGYIIAIHVRQSAQPPPARPSDGSQASRQQFQQQRVQRQEGIPADEIHLVEVLLDAAVVDGTTLDGRCPPYRGTVARPHQILDLTSWGLGQSTTGRPSAAAQTVDAVRPVPTAPAPGQQRARAAAGGTAEVAAKARALFNRPSTASAASVDVPEPPQAPWAASQPRMATGHSTADDIIKTLLAGPSWQAAPPAPVDEKAHAQNIINTLLAGPMGAMSLNAPRPVPGGGWAAAPASAAAAPVPGAAAQAPAGPRQQARRRPVIVEEYVRGSSPEDSDEEHAGEPAPRGSNPAAVPPPVHHCQIPFDYGAGSPDRGRGRGRGRGFGRGRGSALGRGRGRGRGRGLGSSSHAPQ
ncbi:exonuclease II Exo2 [Coemansia javaensis]|uniref:Exonuclease II Exo2 n=1 Tax=Coemansia javaensis TaxID=2761396 RepID=A0A9W8H968_9FUNG|nr:exonuclease II Exo2 [Coemansia javaensis]